MPDRPVVLVTGSAQRIGLVIATTLAAAGWDVAVHFRHAAAAAAEAVESLVALGARAHAFGADLADEDLCEALVPAVQQQFGRIDAVVNNASAFELDDVASFSPATMERMWRANTAPAVILARALHRALPAGRSGAVVNLLDQKLWNLNPDYFSYTLSKAALQAATTMLAQALAPNVRVCGVAPGLVLGSELIGADQLLRLQSATPLQTGATPEDVAAAVLFMLNSKTITGSTVIIDAGSHLRATNRDFAFQ